MEMAESGVKALLQFRQLFSGKWWLCGDFYHILLNNPLTPFRTLSTVES